MALFPGKVDDAVNAAIDMQKQVKKFNEIRRLSNREAIRIGIGIHTGNLMLGTIGEKNRIETTVISDAVNIASRLESLNKKLESKILISKNSYVKLKDAEKFQYKNIGKVNIRGKKNMIGVVEVIISAKGIDSEHF